MNKVPINDLVVCAYLVVVWCVGTDCLWVPRCFLFLSPSMMALPRGLRIWCTCARCTLVVTPRLIHFSVFRVLWSQKWKLILVLCLWSSFPDSSSQRSRHCLVHRENERAFGDIWNRAPRIGHVTTISPRTSAIFDKICEPQETSKTFWQN